MARRHVLVWDRMGVSAFTTEDLSSLIVTCGADPHTRGDSRDSTLCCAKELGRLQIHGCVSTAAQLKLCGVNAA